MKRRLLVQKEVPSMRFPSISYAIVAAPPSFVRSEIFTVFPDVKTHMAKHNIPIKAPSRTPIGDGDTPTSSSESCEFQEQVVFQGPYCLVTFQQVDPTTDTSLIAFSDDATEFKDESREHFFNFMREVRGRLCTSRSPSVSSSSQCETASNGIDGGDNASTVSPLLDANSKWFVDWVDPATGLPVNTNTTSTIFCESDGVEQLLKMEIVYVNGPGGGCRLIKHPQYGINSYPASGFVCGGTADELLEALRGI